MNPPSPLRRLFVIGDSISMQYGPYLEKFVSSKLEYDRKRDDGREGSENDLNAPTGLGANGGDSSMVLAYLNERVKRGGIPADILLLNCGLHDIKTTPATGAKQIPIRCYEENLRAILAKAREMRLKVVWVRTTAVIDAIHNTRSVSLHRFAADVDAYNAVADAIMREEGVPMIDLHALSLHCLPENIVDHVHYDEATREKQAAFIAGALGGI